jgi:hypothetical protein
MELPVNKMTSLALIINFLCIPAHADLFGSDTAVLSQILTQNLKQLVELQKIVGVGQNTLDLENEINRGINDSLNLAKTISQSTDPGAFGGLKHVNEVLKAFHDVYGTPIDSPDAKAQSNVDQSIAEAVTMNNQLYDYARDIDKIGEQIKSYSHSVSPGGAQKLTAQSLGVIVHVLNQSLRAQGTLLKLQAQSLAQNNKREKDYTKEFLKASETLTGAMGSADPKFETPRF